MARVKGVIFLPYLFTEGVSSPHLHAHYSPPGPHPECIIRWGSDPIFGEKNENGPIWTFRPISFYGGLLAKNGFWDFCWALCPLWENKGGGVFGPLIFPEKWILVGALEKLLLWRERGEFSRQIGSVDDWKWWERGQRGVFSEVNWQMSHFFGACPLPSSYVKMTNVIPYPIVGWCFAIYPGDIISIAEFAV